MAHSRDGRGSKRPARHPAHLPEQVEGDPDRAQHPQSAGRFEDFIEQLCRLLPARGISSGRDPRLPIYISMVWLEYGDTLETGRARERLMINTAARIGRLLRFDPRIETA